jgi:two-component system chemotaxis response regulator CheB
MIKVLVVDDSAFMRTIIRDMLAGEPSIEIAATASDGVDALEKILAFNPDVITLDIEMPRMNGLDLLRELRKIPRRPKVLMLSSLSSAGAELTDEAIRLGADDFLVKPKDLPHIREIGRELISKVTHLATLPPVVHPRTRPHQASPADRIVLIGSSAGGPPQIDVLLSMLSPVLPAAILITQHMPVGFTAPLAERFDRIAPMPVRETRNGDPLLTGEILLSMAGVHTLVSGVMEKNGRTTGRIVHTTSPPVHGVRPAVDKTFESAARIYGKNAVSIILSGMGNDAGAGASAIKQAGGVSLVCDEKDCLVYGMARSAISRNAVDEILPLKKLAESIEQHVLRMEGAACV